MCKLEHCLNPFSKPATSSSTTKQANQTVSLASKDCSISPSSLREPPPETHLLLSFLNVRVKKAPGIVTIAGVLIHEKEIGQITWLSPLSKNYSSLDFCFVCVCFSSLIATLIDSVALSQIFWTV